MSELGAAAAWYAQHGIPVMPCLPRDKRPLTAHGFKDATTDPATVAAWWSEHPDANIAIPTGTASGLLVVDVDPRNGGPADRSELIERFGPIPDTAEVLTGGGGRHLFFRHPGGKVPKELCEGVDLKADGGYVIAPPSIHPTGKRYEIDGMGGAAAFLKVADPPAWLTERIFAQYEDGDGASSHGGKMPASPEPIPAGRRNATLTSMAGAMRRKGMPEVAILAGLEAVNAACCRPPLPEPEVRRIVASVGRYEPEQAANFRSVEDTPDSPRPHLTVADVPSVNTIDGGDVRFLVDGLILEGGITMLTGPAGCGKTTLAAALAAHVACGAPFASREVQQRPVLILDRENTLQVVQERLYRLGASDGSTLRWWGGWLQDEAPSPASAVVMEWIASLDVMPLVVMDSVVAFLDGDENSANDVRRFLHPLRRLTQSGVTLVLLHHSGKGATTTEYRGSSDFPAGIDTGFLVSNTGDPTRFEKLRLRAYKLRLRVSGDVMLSFNEADGVFTERDAQPQARNDAELFRDLLRRNPGIGASGFEDEAAKAGLTRGHARMYLKQGVDDGRVRMVSGDRNRHHYYIKGGPDDWLQQ